MLGFVRDMMGLGVPGGTASAINGTTLLSQTATGSTQATAFQLTVSGTEFTTVAASTGAVLPALASRLIQGDALSVYNQGANALSVYPPVGFRIGTASVNAAVSVAAGKSATFTARGDGNYFSLVSA